MKIIGSGTYISLMTCALYDQYTAVPKYFSVARLFDTCSSPELEFKSLREVIAKDSNVAESDLATICYIPPCPDVILCQGRRYFLFLQVSASNPGMRFTFSTISEELTPVSDDMFKISKVLDAITNNAHKSTNFRGYSRDEIHVTSMSLSPVTSST